MKKIWIILLLAVALAGCKVQHGIKLDTIVDIPLHPTEAVSQPAAETTAEQTETNPAPASTEPSTAPTEEETIRIESGSKPSNTKKPEKTAKPTENPTEKPTERPTEVPTEKPTERPTEAPTEKPTERPTEAPTEKPTEAPTEVPTAPSTEPPTEIPTSLPTTPPTEAPTAPLPQLPDYDPSGYTPNRLDRGVADAVNARREDAGLAPLQLDPRLCAIASVRAYEASLEWSQNRPDGSAGLTVLTQYGYAHSAAGQNLYFGGGSPESIVSKWMSSDARRETILMASAAAIGVGSFTAGNGVTYVAALIVG